MKISGTVKNMFKHNHRTLYGMPVEQTWASLFVIEKMLADMKPDVISELGTGDGTLSLYLQTYCRLHSYPFHTRDLDPSRLDPSVYQMLGTSFTAADCHLPQNVRLMAQELAAGMRPFLLIDGADPKSYEVNLFAPALKPGTIIFSHDYHTDPANDSFRWGYGDAKIDWLKVEKLEPYNMMAVQMNTRMLCLRVR